MTTTRVRRPEAKAVVAEPPSCEAGGCSRPGAGLRSCATYGRCCEAPRRPGESDRDWLARTRPWVGAAGRWQAKRLAAA